MEFEYYTYGDFQSQVNSIHMVANLFSNHTYQSWFTVVMLLTIAAFAFQATAERIFGAKASDAIWIKRVMIGTVLYSIFMVPTVTLHVYDPIKNKYEAIGGIPAGVGLIAGMTSGFTKEISGLIETAGSPILDIKDIGFGHGYEMLSAVSSLGSIGLSQDQYLARTLADYFDKCVIQMNASGDLDFNALWNGNGKDLLENIRTDYRIFNSTIWTAANPGGYMVYCADAYTHIANELKKPDRINQAFKVFCSKMNYNPTDTQEFLQCRQKFAGVYNAFSANDALGYNETNLFASAVIAKMYLVDGINAGVERAKEIARSMATAADAVSGAMAADFMPMIQGMVATILIFLFVIVALLMYVAPMDAFKFYFGLWIWFLTWVLVDVVINMQVQNYAYEVFRDMRETGLSLTTFFNIGDRSAQVLGWYGKARWMSMTIASMMTYGIFKFGGGAAFASFAGALGASYSGQAASQGAQIGAPGGEAAQYKKTLDDLSMVPATTMASFDGGSSMRALQNANKAYLSKQISHGAGISDEAASRGISTWGFGGAQGENQAMQDGAGVSQYQRYQDEGITSSQLGNMNAYNSIRNVNKVEALEANGIDAATGGQADAHKDAGSVKGEQMGEAFEKEHGMGYGDLAAKGGFHRLLKSATEYKTANDNGWETITTDFNGNVIGREGYYAKMNVDTDGDGVGMEMTNVRYNSATGELTGMYNGKSYKLRGEFSDSDGSDGKLSIKPSEAEWTSTHQKLNVNGHELTGVQVKGFGLGNESSMKIEGSTMINGEMKKVNAFGQGDIKQGEHGAYASGKFSIFDADSSYLTTHREGMDKQVIDRDTVTEDKGRRVRTGDQIKTGDDIEDIDRNVITVDKGLRSKTGDESRVVDIDTETYDRGVNYGGIFAASLQQDKAAEVAAQPVLKAKEASYDAETGTYDLQKYKDTFSTHSDAQSKDWASGASQIMTSKGLIASSFDMGAKGQIGLHGSGGLDFFGNGVKVQTSADASIGVNRTNQEQHNTDLLYGVDQQMQKDAAALATDKDGNLDSKAYSDILGAMRYDATNQIKNAGAEATEFQFGASALISESVKPTFDDMKDFVTGKDASLLNASPETKAAMLEGLKARVGTAPDGSSGLDNLIKKYKSESSERTATSNHVPNPFK